MTHKITHHAQALLILAALSAAGCSLRSAPIECSTTEDCARFEAADDVFYQCGEDNTCTEDAAIECRAQADCAAGSTCNAQNTCEVTDVEPDAGPDADTGPDADAGPDLCTSNQECIDEFGVGQACAEDGACFSLLGENGQCERVHYTQPANEVENVVYFGTMLPLVEPFGSIIGRPIENAVQLAVDDFNKAGGLPDGRKIAWVSCDSKGNAGVARVAATHLVDTVGVPATLGPLFSEPFIEVTSSVTNPKNVLSFQPTGTSPQIGGNFLPKKLVWRNIATDVFQGHAAGKWIQDTGLTKVLVFYKDDSYGEDLTNEVTKILNADAALEVKYVKYTNPVEAADPSTAGLGLEYAQDIRDAMRPSNGDPDFDPELVYIVGTNEGAIAVGAYFQVFQTLGLAAPARILLSHGVIPAMVDLAKSLEASELEMIIPLIDGVAPDIFDPTSTTYQSYFLKYTNTFDNAPPALASTTSFDGIISILLAMSAIPDGDPITGTNIAAQFPRLAAVGSTVVTFFETSYIGTARGRLALGEDIDLVGISGDLDYDQDTGEVYTEFINWKLEKNPSTGKWGIKQVQKLGFPNAPDLDGGAWTPVE